MEEADRLDDEHQGETPEGEESLEELQKSILSLCEDEDDEIITGKSMLAPSTPTMANVAEGDTMLLHHDDEDEMQRLEHEIIMLCHDQYYDPASTAAADKYEDLVEQIISFCETDDMDKIQLPRYQLKQQETAAGVAESTSMHDSLVTGADAVLPPDGDLVKLSSTLPFDDEAGSSMLENEESGNAENLDKSAAPASLKLSKIDLSGIIGTPQRNKILPPKIEEDSSDEETEALTSSDRLTGNLEKQIASPAIGPFRPGISALSTPKPNTPVLTQFRRIPLPEMSPILQTTTKSATSADTPGRFTNVMKVQVNTDREGTLAATSGSPRKSTTSQSKPDEDEHENEATAGKIENLKLSHVTPSRAQIKSMLRETENEKEASMIVLDEYVSDTPVAGSSKTHVDERKNAGDSGFEPAAAVVKNVPVSKEPTKVKLDFNEFMEEIDKGIDTQLAKDESHSVIVISDDNESTMQQDDKENEKAPSSSGPSNDKNGNNFKKFFRSISNTIGNVVNKFKDPIAKNQSETNQKQFVKATGTKSQTATASVSKKESKPEDTLSFLSVGDTPLRNFLVDHNSELMKRVCKQWKHDGILSPEVNLTCSNYLRKRLSRQSKSSTSHVNGRLEGDNVSNFSVPQSNNSQIDTKKRKRTETSESLVPQKRPCLNNRTPGMTKTLRLEAATVSEREFRERLQNILLENERRHKDLLQCHLQQKRELQMQQREEKMRLWNQYPTPQHYQASYHWDHLHQEHLSQVMALDHTHGGDIQQLEMHCRQRIQAEKDRHTQRIKFTMDSIEQQAKVNHVFVPNEEYVCVYLQKNHRRPLRDTEECEDEVYLPATIAQQIQEEDKLYDSIYIYQ